MARVGCRTHQLQRSFRKLVEHWPGGELQHCRYHVDEQVECADTVLVREERQRAGLLVTGGPDHHDHVCANGGCQRERQNKKRGGGGVESDGPLLMTMKIDWWTNICCSSAS